jgi:hypothetical protein
MRQPEADDGVGLELQPGADLEAGHVEPDDAAGGVGAPDVLQVGVGRRDQRCVGWSADGGQRAGVHCGTPGAVERIDTEQDHRQRGATDRADAGHGQPEAGLDLGAVGLQLVVRAVPRLAAHHVFMWDSKSGTQGSTALRLQQAGCIDGEGSIG